MKTTKQFNNRLNLMTQSKWFVSTTMLLALAAAVLGLLGCSPPHQH